MKHQAESVMDIMGTPPRVAVVGGGIAGLTCARELCLRGCDPVVFEADDRLGGRCSSRSTRLGLFDDGAQCIGGANRLAAHVVQQPGELAVLHAWPAAATPAEVERSGKDWTKDEDEADVTRTLKLMGAVGVPSMGALADALARPLAVQLNTPIVQARRRSARRALSSAAGEADEDFQARVLARPAPPATSLLRASSEPSDALGAVHYRSRWMLLLGSERPVPLPGYRAFQASPIERIAAMHNSRAMPSLKRQPPCPVRTRACGTLTRGWRFVVTVSSRVRLTGCTAAVSTWREPWLRVWGVAEDAAVAARRTETLSNSWRHARDH